MGRTQLTSREIGNVQRNDFDIITVGQAVITKIIAGGGVSISQTGVDVGTGDVTVTLAFTSNNYTSSQTLVANSFNNFDATTGNLVATLPTAVGTAGQIVTVRKADSTNNLITMATTLSQTINESSANTVILRKNGWSFDFESDGTNWKIV